MLNRMVFVSLSGGDEDVRRLLGGGEAGADRRLRVQRAQVVAGEEDSARERIERRLQLSASREAVGRAGAPALHMRLFDDSRKSRQHLVEVADIGVEDVLVVLVEQLL